MHRRKVIELIGEANAAGAGLLRACGVIGICLRTLKRWRKGCMGDFRGHDRRKGSHRLLTHKLSEEERQRILLTCNQPQYAALPPGQIVPALADQGLYIGSESSFYRVLHQAGQCHRRGRARLPQESRSVPRLRADRPNAVWSWDITKLKGPAKWTCFHLYVILDIFSRYVVGWLIAPRESAELAQQLIADTVARHDVMPGELTLHADRGTSMRSKPVASLLVDLDVAKSHSRPYTSDDNPYSESQFKTMKYRPDFPERFGSIEDARSHCQTFFAWYNAQHCHSGIGHMTPHSVHYGQAQAMREVRQATLNAAFAATPNRFKGIRPCLKPMPTATWINPLW